MKVAVIGVGYWGKKHVEEYSKLGCEVYGVDVVELTDLSKKYGLKQISLQDTLSDKSITHVSICVPNHLHYEVAKKCLLAEKNVLVEKPLVTNSTDGFELKKIAEEKGLNISVGHIYRFNNAIEQVRDLIKSNSLGKIYSIMLVWNNLEEIKSDRDIIFDLAPHPFDIINYFFDKNPDSVSCFARAFRTSKEEIAFITGSVDNALVSIELSWITPKKERSVTVIGSEKSVFVDALSQQATVFTNATKTYEPLDVIANNTLGDELSFFIKLKKEKRADVDVGIVVVKMLEKCVEEMKKSSSIKGFN